MQIKNIISNIKEFFSLMNGNIFYKYISAPMVFAIRPLEYGNYDFLVWENQDVAEANEDPLCINWGDLSAEEIIEFLSNCSANEIG